MKKIVPFCFFSFYFLIAAKTINDKIQNTHNFRTIRKLLIDKKAS